MLKPGFHSAAFLAHLSSGIDAIRIAILYFSLLCASIQQRIFAIFICSIVAAVFLFRYSIHSSSSSSSVSAASISSSVSFMNEMSLSWFLVSLFFLLFRSPPSSSLFFLVADLCLLFVFSFCLDNEGEHFALCRLCHFLMFFRKCPCAGSVVHRRSDHHVEQAESVLQEV